MRNSPGSFFISATRGSFRAAIVLLSLVACVTAKTPASSGPHPAENVQDEPEWAPKPFTADQIRQATVPGRTWEWAVEEAGQSPSHEIIVFTAANDREGDIEDTTLPGDGRQVTESTPHVPWSALMHHADFPRAATVMTSETITTPAGTFDCLRYDVSRGEAMATFYFAKTLPGPPILFFTEKQGKRIRTSTLVRYVSGRK